jgi:hypothetical protein
MDLDTILRPISTETDSELHRAAKIGELCRVSLDRLRKIQFEKDAFTGVEIERFYVETIPPIGSPAR